MRIPLPPQSSVSRSSQLSSQRLVNAFLEEAPKGAKAPTYVLGAPGKRPWQTVGDGPIKGTHDFNGLLVVGSGNRLYIVTPNSVTDIGGIQDGSRPIRMEHNTTQLGILTGTTGLVYANGTLTAINDPEFQPAADLTFLDNYIIWVHSGTGQIFTSKLSDMLQYEGLDFATAEANPDILLGCRAVGRQMQLFGTKTTEFWYNAGNADFPFRRVPGGVIEHGCATRDSITVVDGSAIWLTDKRIIVQTQGMGANRISTHAIERELEKLTTDEILACDSLSYVQEGHTFYALSFPKQTFVMDLATGLWHERKSYGVGRWNASHAIRAFDKNLVGWGNKLFSLDLDYDADDEQPLERIVTCPSPDFERRRARWNRIELEIDTGVGLSSGQGSDPQVMLKWSDDGGHTWSNEHWAGLGKIGQFKHRAVWTRKGQSRDRIFQFSISDRVPVRAMSIYAEVDVDSR